MIGEKVLSLLGIDTKPLGYDSNNCEYWKFPISEDLFIYTNQVIDEEKIKFFQSLNKIYNLRKAENGVNSNIQMRNWKRISKIEDIKRIVEYLSDDIFTEKVLKSNIISNFLLDRVVEKVIEPIKEVVSEEHVVNGEGNPTEVDNVDGQDNNGNTVSFRNKVNTPIDNTPVALKLLPDKGQIIQTSYIIDLEASFEDDAAEAEYAGNAEAIISYEYFTFSKAKRFSVVLFSL